MKFIQFGLQDLETVNDELYIVARREAMEAETRVRSGSVSRDGEGSCACGSAERLTKLLAETVPLKQYMECV